MSPVVLDANAVIAHGRAFPERARLAFENGEQLVLPRSVKRELVDEGYLRVDEPDYETYGGVIDEARRRIADDSVPEHAVKADQYIPAIVCEFAQRETVELVTADRKLGDTVRTIAEKQGVADSVSVHQPGTVL